MNIAIINKKIPQEDRASGCKRLTELLRILAKEHNIDFYPINKNHRDENYQNRLLEAGINIFQPGLKNLLKCLYHKQYDIVLVEFYTVAEQIMWILKNYQPNAMIIVDSVDLHFIRYAQEVQQGLMPKNKYERLKKREIDTYRKADVVITVSNEEKNILKKYNINNCVVIPNIVEVNACWLPAKRENKILFVGNFGHYPNSIGLKWFLEKCWILLIESSNNIMLDIVGNGLSNELLKTIQSNEHIKYHGYVEELLPLYTDSKVAIAPLTIGGGVKGKVNEAMAYGIPLVTTSIGIQGINAKNYRECLIADEPRSFVNAIIKVIDSDELQKKLNRKSLSLANSTHSKKVIKEKVEKIINTINIKNNNEKVRSYYILGLVRINVDKVIIEIKKYIKNVLNK